jgi:hypothetical protein
VRGRDAALAIAAWAGMLAVLAALAPLLGSRDRVELSQLPLAVLGALALALVATRLRDRRVLDVRDASVGTPAVAIGLVLVGAGAAIGLWLVLAAVPVIVLGIVALILETRA